MKKKFENGLATAVSAELLLLNPRMQLHAKSCAVMAAWLGWLISRKRKSLDPFDPTYPTWNTIPFVTSCCTFRFQFWT